MIQFLKAEFPRHDFEDGKTLLNAIGSFWAQVFKDSGRLESEFRATGDVFLQTHINFLEAVATLSRFECPVFHEEKWFLLTLKKSSKLATSGVLKYGEGPVYGPQPVDNRTFLYGTVFREEFAFKIDDDIRLADAEHIQNRILDPSVVLTKGINYKYDRATGILTFDEDPFKNELFARRVLYGTSNTIEDEEIALWLPNAEFDNTFLFDHFGYAIQVAARSSTFYKDFINAFWNMLNRTPTLLDVRLLLTAMTGVGTAVDSGEVVEFVERTGGKLQVITDLRVYQFKETAVELVGVGDVLEAGQELVDTVQIIELSGANRDLSAVKAIALGREFLSDGFFSHLIFKNQLTALNFEGIDSDGRAFVKFDIGGFPSDVDRFWNEVQQRGKDAGATLAELLDTRENPPTDPSLPPEITQPGPEHLPLEVNPLEFMVDNLLKNNLFIIRLKPADILSEALGIEFFHVMRQAIPPHTTFIVLMESTAPLEIVDLGQQGGTDPCIGLENAGPGVQDETFNDENCVVVPLIGHFIGPETRPFSEVGIGPSSDASIQDAMVRPRIVRTI